MKKSYQILEIIFLVFVFSVQIVAQSAQCPLSGDNCGNQLKLYFAESVSPLTKTHLNFGPNDSRNGTYLSISTGDDWSLFDVDPTGSVLIDLTYIYQDQVFECNNITINESCSDECFKCPSQIQNSELGKLRLTFEQAPTFNVASIKLTLNEGNPNNGTYSGVPVSSDTYDYTVPNDLCCTPLNAIIEIEETGCTIENNLVESCAPASPIVTCAPFLPINTDECNCGGIVHACQDDIVDFISAEFASTGGCSQWLGPCDQESFIHHPGLVVIGDEDLPVKSGYRLAVKGGIITERVRVLLCDTYVWCDYVFEEDYNLLSPKEVETYISKNGHLPGMISEQEVIKEEGIELKAISLQQQEKIEEAYLHLINLNEKVIDLKSKLKEVNEENGKLKAKLE